MTKDDLKKIISSETNLTQKKVEEIIECILDTIIEVVKVDGSITFNNFGKFERKFKKEKRGINPQTGDLVLLPPKEVFIFKPSKNIFKTEE